MIPKIIHYCWFGDNPLPESALECIQSWRKYCPDFEIMLWNEKNYDIHSHQFVKECYESKKYGFIVDVLRMHALKEYGGIYLDTDVEFIKPLDIELLNKRAFIGYEINNFIGVGLVASEKNGAFVNDILNDYKDRHFLNIDGTPNTSITGPVAVTNIIKLKKFNVNGEFEEKKDYLTIYPIDYFSPKNYLTGLMEISKNTYTIHHYDATWVDSKEEFVNNQRLNRKKYYLSKFIEDSNSNEDLINSLKVKIKFSNFDLVKFAIKDFIKNISNHK